MTRPMSRKGRKAAFLEKAEEMFAELEEWYDQNPEASFEEIERQARKARRKMMGSASHFLSTTACLLSHLQEATGGSLGIQSSQRFESVHIFIRRRQHE